MRLLVLVLASFALACSALSAAASPPRTIEVQNGPFHLKGLIWVPTACRRCPAILFNHGRSDTVDELIRQRRAQILGPIFAQHGYALLFIYRRGEGLSAGQGTFISDLLDREQHRRGPIARDRLQARLLTTEQLSDEMAGIAFLRRRWSVLRGPARAARSRALPFGSSGSRIRAGGRLVGRVAAAATSFDPRRTDHQCACANHSCRKRLFHPARAPARLRARPLGKAPSAQDLSALRSHRC